MAKLAQMTEDEVRTRYRQAADKHAQIGILAELNAVKKSDIEKILFGTATTELPPKRKYTRTDEAMQEQIAREFYEGDYVVKELAAKYGISITSVMNYINKFKDRFTVDAPATAKSQTKATVPKKSSVDAMASISTTVDTLFKMLSSGIDRVDNSMAGFDELVVTKSRQRISLFMEKGAISVSISKDIGTEEGGDGYGITA